MNTETLGALIDKLSIVNLKLWHCQELLFGTQAVENRTPDEKLRLEQKNESLIEQRARLIQTINEFISEAIRNPQRMVLANPQNKIYGRFRTDEGVRA